MKNEYIIEISDARPELFKVNVTAPNQEDAIVALEEVLYPKYFMENQNCFSINELLIKNGQSDIKFHGVGDSVVNYLPMDKKPKILKITKKEQT